MFYRRVHPRLGDGDQFLVGRKATEADHSRGRAGGDYQVEEDMVRIHNITRDQTLANRAWEAVTRAERRKGLLGRDSLDKGEGLVIRGCIGIHSFFMRFAFDVAFVDREGTVMHTIRRMKPWRISRIVPRAAGVVELPAGVLKATGTQVDDRLRFDRDYRGGIQDS